MADRPIATRLRCDQVARNGSAQGLVRVGREPSLLLASKDGDGFVSGLRTRAADSDPSARGHWAEQTVRYEYAHE